MKWILRRLRRLTALPSQPAPSQEPHKPSVPKSPPVASSSHHAQTTFDAETSLKDIPGVTDQMLIAFSERLSSDLDGVDRSVLDLLADMCVQARIASGEDLESGQDSVRRFQNGHNGHVAWRSQRRPNVVGKLLEAGRHRDDWNG
jgi:hypothetical protein